MNDHEGWDWGWWPKRDFTTRPRKRPEEKPIYFWTRQVGWSNKKLAESQLLKKENRK